MITIRTSCNKRVKEEITPCFNKALSWMKKKYPKVNFDNVDYIFSGGYSRSRYFRNEKGDAKYKKPTVCVSTRGELYLYPKYSLGISKKFTGMHVGSDVQMICSLIHELTHHVQYEQNHRKGNELDTTRNELEYLKEFEPQYYKTITSD